MKLLVALFAFFFISGCVKERRDCGCVMPYQVYYLKAKVVQTSDLACNRPVLDFSEDSVRIRMMTNLDNLAYTVINLPANKMVQDKKLYVSVAKLIPSEDFPCNNLGLLLPRLKVLDAKDRD